MKKLDFGTPAEFANTGEPYTTMLWDGLGTMKESEGAFYSTFQQRIRHCLKECVYNRIASRYNIAMAGVEGYFNLTNEQFQILAVRGKMLEHMAYRYDDPCCEWCISG